MTPGLLDQRKIVSQLADIDGALHVHPLMRGLRAAAAVGLAQDGNQMAVAFAGIVARRIWPHAAVPEEEIHMGAGLEWRQRSRPSGWTSSYESMPSTR